MPATSARSSCPPPTRRRPHDSPRLTSAPPPSRSALGLVVRPGSPVQPAVDAVAALRDDDRVVVTGVEVGWSPDWRSVLALEVPVVVEVGRGCRPARRTRRHRRRGRRRGRRDSEVPHRGDPDVALARRARARRLPRRRGPARALLQADRRSAPRGAGESTPASRCTACSTSSSPPTRRSTAPRPPSWRSVLAQTSAELLTERAARLTAVDAARVRGSFTAYGCCGVLDPLVELAALGLIDEHPHLDH